eukprot:TRINITY_DN693_c0_g1_i5.p1 TRINITY_DN693_c0_g1~~TRINITY_DN693_c0_g1_i5.p1  ORF type:complete len:331 (-),score=45.45 TRINITY_DN693_c0_g1_i5:181-1173(-)
MSCFFVLSLCLAVHDAFGAVVVTSDAAALLPENGAKVAGGARALAGAESRPLMRSAAATGALMARRERNTSDGEAAPAPSAEPAATTGSAAGDAQPAGPTGARRKHLDFFLQTVPTRPYVGLEAHLIQQPEPLAEVFRRSGHRLVRNSCSTCAVVGGAASLLKDGRPGHEIDGHDCVFRTNKGISQYSREEQPTTSGQKTTHFTFYCCWDGDEAHRLNHKNASDWIFVPTAPAGTSWAISALKDGSMQHNNLVIMDPKFIKRVTDEANLSRKPLAGTLVLSAAMQICSSPIDLYGFDVWDKSHYDAESHNPKEDHAWIRHLQSSGAVRVH